MTDDAMLVFVYGSLLAGEANHRELGDATCLGAATTRPEFTLFDLGPYPALVADGAQAVVGEVYEVDDAALQRLDRFEGHPDLYTRTAITLADGRSAQTYLMDRARVGDAPPIASGAWRRGGTSTFGALPDLTAPSRDEWNRG